LRKTTNELFHAAWNMPQILLKCDTEDFHWFAFRYPQFSSNFANRVGKVADSNQRAWYLAEGKGGELDNGPLLSQLQTSTHDAISARNRSLRLSPATAVARRRGT
jgi:hypothetical protein